MTSAQLPTAAHTATSDAVASALDLRAEVGLGRQQGVERLAKWGPNALPVTPPRSPWRVLLAQFKSVMIVILLGAALLAAWVGSVKDASVILAVVVINALVGFYQEYRAERSLDALKSMLPANATVRRDGSSQKIDAEAVVPGDILLLEAGDSVSADGRLIVAAGLEIDESALTGESQPAAKQCEPLAGEDAPLGDRSNMVYMNTLLTRGRAEVLVTATGSHTEMGKLSRELAATVEVPTPLQVQLDQLAKRLGAIALTLVALLSLMQFLRGKDLPHILLDAIALAVAAMPEGLPVVVTVTLALGMHKMARQHAIVSALGVEEERVRVLIDITSPQAEWQGLGDGYRVSVRIVTLSEAKAVQVPVSAVFPLPDSASSAALAGPATAASASAIDSRAGAGVPPRHAVFVVDEGRARQTVVVLGARNGNAAWIRSGIATGQQVIAYPPATVRDGLRVAARKP